ncbi:DUF1439 domain-containing protein [Leptotrichia hofstadii]|jgi:hypothetical protein|uniref:DUF1439 domain-containing protein n=2 Tax=Leptotrichia hofstadii TaxID=157688 RepID=C9MU42_9FUSO|nr:DUF1439 domain-containing protein [Leptotrichia hofstadii]EEX75849.1 hypothetical protein GCWU000323_00060 [Leptotrichia hofstadii F0254]
MKSKNSFLKTALLMLIMMFGVISCDFLANKTIRVPNSVIESKAKEKFPITKNFLLGKITVKNPKISFKDNRVYVVTDYDASLLADRSEGVIEVNSEIKFDENTNQLYLVDMQVEKILDKNGKDMVSTPVARSMKALIANYLETNPVYKYEPDGKKKVKVKNMFIKNGKLFVQT